jgi:hypothetical protein
MTRSLAFAALLAIVLIGGTALAATATLCDDTGPDW